MSGTSFDTLLRRAKLAKERAKNGGKSNFDVSQLKEKHQMIIRLDLLGYNCKEIAEALGYSPGWVSQLQKSKKYKDKLQATRAALDDHFEEKLSDALVNDKVIQRLREVAEDALETVLELMEGAESENVRQKSAFDVLDRAGYRPSDRVEMEHSGGLDLGVEVTDKMEEDIRKGLEDIQSMLPAAPKEAGDEE